MAEITQAELKKQISLKNFAPLYLFYGDESYLITTYVKKLTDAVVKKETAAFSLHRFDADEAQIDDVINALNVYPFIAEKNFIVLIGLDIENLSSEDKKKLTDYIKDPNPSAVLLMYYPSSDSYKRAAKWNDFIKTFKKYGAVVNFSRKTQAEVEKLVCSYAAKFKCELLRSDAAYLISVCGNDLQTLFNETEKLCAYSNGEKITKEMINNVVSFNAETTVFVLSRALVSGQLEKAYSLLDLLFKQNEKAISILGALSGTYVDLYRVKAAILSGHESRELAKIFSYRNREFVLENAARSVRTLSIGSLRKSLELLSDTDILLKSTSAENHRRILEELFAKLYQLRLEG